MTESVVVHVPPSIRPQFLNHLRSIGYLMGWDFDMWPYVVISTDYYATSVKEAKGNKVHYLQKRYFTELQVLPKEAVFEYLKEVCIE